jgi:hypothetical protein
MLLYPIRFALKRALCKHICQTKYFTSLGRWMFRLGDGWSEVRHEPSAYHFARMRYCRTDVPSLATGTLNCAAKAAVFVNL